VDQSRRYNSSNQVATIAHLGSPTIVVAVAVRSIHKRLIVRAAMLTEVIEGTGLVLVGFAGVVVESDSSCVVLHGQDHA
jgi:hypothetical protein